MALVVKSELTQVSNYLGALVGVVGNVLPYLTPDFLAGLGLSAPSVHVASSVIAVLLFAYREKAPAPSVTLAVPPTSGDNTNAKP